MSLWILVVNFWWRWSGERVASSTDSTGLPDTLQHFDDIIISYTS